MILFLFRTGDEVVFAEHDPHDAALMHRVGLEQHGRLAHRLGVLDDHPHMPRARPVRNLEPLKKRENF